MINKLKIKNQDGVVQEYDLGGDTSRKLTLAEYNALPETERNNGTYYITDATLKNTDVSTAGSIKSYVYDDEETVIGVYEGKPLYRKHVITNPLGSEQVSYLYSTEGLDVVNLNFILVNPDGNQGKPESKIGNSYYETSTTYYRAQNNEGYIQLIRGNTQSWSTWYGDFIIEYTKTTDAEGSGEGLMPYGYVGKGSTNNNYSTNEEVIGTWIDGKPVMRLVCEYDNFTPSSSSWTDLPNKSELNTLVTYPINVTLMNDDYSVRPNYWYGQIKTDFIGVVYNRLVIEYVKKGD